MQQKIREPIIKNLAMLKKDEKVIYAGIYLAFTIMGDQNYSFFTNYYYDGVSVIWRHNQVHTHLAHVTHKLVMTLPYKKLRFVTCGRRGFTPLPFGELFYIYDMYVWLCISLCFVFTPFILNRSYSKLIRRSRTTPWKFRLVKTWIMHCKCLLEQGEPFSKKIEETTFLRWIVATLILTSIVLSNAYKNANMYNLITNRKPLLYETFSQILEEKFKIYTRVGRLSILPLGFSFDFEGSKLVVSNHTVSFVRKNKTDIKANFFAESEVIGISESLENNKFQNSEERKWVNTLKNYSSLYENTSIRLHNLANSINTLLEIELLDAVLSPEVKAKAFRVKEWAWTKLSLEKCSKTAFVLAEPACNRLAIETKSRGSEFIWVSKQVFSEVGFGWIPSGNVRPEILSRLQGAHESGIDNWLSQIARYTSKLYRSEATSPKSASLSGNILVIFVVLIVILPFVFTICLGESFIDLV